MEIPDLNNEIVNVICFGFPSDFKSLKPPVNSKFWEFRCLSKLWSQAFETTWPVLSADQNFKRINYMELIVLKTQTKQDEMEMKLKSLPQALRAAACI